MASFSLLVMALYILTLNCNGIRDQSKRIGLVQWLRSLPVSVDVVWGQWGRTGWCLSLLRENGRSRPP